MSARSIVNWFASLYSDLGLIGCSSHSGRCTFITAAARILPTTGGSLRDVQELAGHRSIATTERYIAGNRDAQRKLITRIYTDHTIDRASAMSRRKQESCVQPDSSDLSLAAESARVRMLNDALRITLQGGRIMLTAGISCLNPYSIDAILRAVCTFDSFNACDDPYGEHDFGAVAVGSHRVFFKIDYYDLLLRHGSSDPTDPTVTARVLTIMLAEEY